MFICDNCKKPTRPGEPCTKIPISTRIKEYRNQKKITIGWEIAKEGKFCKKCAEGIEFTPPEVPSPPTDKTKKYVLNEWFFKLRKRRKRRRKKKKKKQEDSIERLKKRYLNV